MSLSQLLLTPDGRLAKAPFWRGYLILLSIQMISMFGVVLIPQMEFIFGAVTMVLHFPYICVAGKRLHDWGQTAWAVIAVYVIYFIIMILLAAIYLASFQYELILEASEYTELPEELVNQLLAEMQKPMIILTFIGWLAVGLGLGALPSDPNANKFGPPSR